MANALGNTPIGGPPPAPNPDAGQSNGSSNAMGQMLPSSPQVQDQQAPFMPAPSAKQTVAAVRHFDIIEQELMGILRDPDIGKGNMKSKIIDGATKLVGSGILTPAQAVVQLGSVPERPIEQKAWLEQQLAQAITAKRNVMSHHQMAFASGRLPPNDGSDSYNPDQHLDVVSGLLDHYNSGQQQPNNQGQ